MCHALGFNPWWSCESVTTARIHYYSVPITEPLTCSFFHAHVATFSTHASWLIAFSLTLPHKRTIQWGDLDSAAPISGSNNGVSEWNLHPVGHGWQSVIGPVHTWKKKHLHKCRFYLVVIERFYLHDSLNQIGTIDLNDCDHHLHTHSHQRGWPYGKQTCKMKMTQWVLDDMNLSPKVQTSKLRGKSNIQCHCLWQGGWR